MLVRLPAPVIVPLVSVNAPVVWLVVPISSVPPLSPTVPLPKVPLPVRASVPAEIVVPPL